MLEKIPNHILRNLLHFTNHQALEALTRTSRKLHEEIAPDLTELREIHQTLVGKASSEIMDACLNSLIITQSVMMSALLFKLDSEQILTLAFTSHDHASVILKSPFIQDKISYRYTTAHLSPKVPIDKIKIEGDQGQSSSSMLGHGYEDILKSLTMKITSFDLQASLLKSNFYTDIDPIEIIERVARRSIDYARIALFEAGRALNGYRLMEIAKLGLDYTKLILESSTLSSRLKPGHLIGIGKTSEKQANYILTYYSAVIQADGIRQIAAASKECASLVLRHIAAYLFCLFSPVIKQKPELTKIIVQAMLDKPGYSPAHTFWKMLLAKNPESAPHLLELLKSIQLMQIQSTINEFVLSRIMKLSPAHAKAVMSVSKVDQIIGQDILKLLAHQNAEYSTILNPFIKPDRSSSSIKTYRR